MDKKLNKTHKNFDTHEINNHTVQYKFLQHNKRQPYHITGQPS